MPLLIPALGGALVVAGIIGVILGVPIVVEFIRTGLVPRLPTAVLAASFVTLGGLSLFGGIIMNAMARSRWEAKRLFYLQMKPPG